MEVKNISLFDLKPYENNPRINDNAVDSVMNSIKEFGFKVPIVITKDNVIVAGHTRYKASLKLNLDEVPCIIADDLNDDQIKAFRLADNKVSELAEWDFSKLEMELAAIELDMSLFSFDLEELEIETEDKYYKSNETSGTVNETFGVPPFSILDTRQGYWQDRKREWIKITGDLTETKENVLYQKDSLMDQINGGSSNFDPVLAELMMKWFNTENGKILDPFGGEQTKGVVAGELGYSYSAVEIRKEQVETNKEKTKQYDKVKYYLGDSNNISEIITDRNFDLVFTSPPYYDLEVYSKEDMSALGTYEEFMQQYKNIFQQCFDMLADNRFLVIKIGEIRNKKTGEYRNFVGDNIQLFKDIGFHYYNEIILVNPCGTVPLRAKKLMETRKIGKVHQNVLVFYKGDLKKIKDEYKVLENGFADFSE